MDRPPVQDAPPPKNVIRFVNPVAKALLRSPMHRLLSKNPHVADGDRPQDRPHLHLCRWDGTSRTTARLWCRRGQLAPQPPWRGRAVRVTLDGRERAAHAVLEEDPDRAAEAFKTMLDHAGPRALAVKVNVDRSPPPAEIKPALADRGVAYLKLTD